MLNNLATNVRDVIKRESGYYWVLHNGDWKPAYYSSGIENWSLCGYDGPVDEEEISEVGEELIHA